eukprot:545080-Pelagomonas_calceolata.AAC.1
MEGWHKRAHMAVYRVCSSHSQETALTGSYLQVTWRTALTAWRLPWHDSRCFTTRLLSRLTPYNNGNN